MKITNIDLVYLQKEIDSGKSYPEISKQNKIGRSTICKYIKLGLLKKSNIKNINQYRNGHSMSDNTKDKIKKSMTGKKLSDETKKKISDSRIKYLKEHPDKVPYKLNHSSKMSYPEKVFQNALISTGITGWEYNFQNGIYSYDFAFVKEKIDIEIDGGTHLTDKVKQIDKRRDEFSRQQGWNVVRFTSKEVKEDVIKCIEKVKTILMES